MNATEIEEAGGALGSGRSELGSGSVPSVGAATRRGAAGPVPISTVPGEFTGGVGRLMWMMLRGVFLVVVTFGFHRFWLRTNLRRYYWNSIRFDREPLEYTGRPLEALLGFLIAIFFLAIYLFVINFALSLYSLAVWQSYNAAIALSFLSVAPLIPFAKYRAQRYLLSRTRWRGIRFGLVPGAWAYARRSIAWTAAALLTLGLLWPVADFRLRRFVTRHTYFGDQRFALEGDAKGLFRTFLLVVFLPGVVGLVLVGAVLAKIEAGLDPEQPFEDQAAAATLGFVAIGVGALLALCWTYYQAYRLRYFLNRTQIGDDLILSSALSPRRVLGVVFGGYLVTALLLAILFSVVVSGGFALVAALEARGVSFEPPELTLEDGPSFELFVAYAPFLAVLLGGYLILYIAASALSAVLVSRRIAAIAARTLTIEHFDRVESVRQRPEDLARSADGFADALDVGPI